MKLNYFNFKEFNGEVLLTNDFGKYLFLKKDDFKKLIANKEALNQDTVKQLEDADMVYSDSDLEYSSNKKYHMRDIKAHVNTATSLHIFVVTTACNMNCIYCQANNGIHHTPLIMTKEVAEKSVDIALQSPAECLTFEFQGGEPLLNFEIIKHIVEYTEEKNTRHKINFTVVTNLTLLTDEILMFLKEHNFSISTSIDGSEMVHNNNRRYLTGDGTFNDVKKTIAKIRGVGMSVGAIETTTRFSLKYPEEIVGAYAELGFNSIFIRPLTPLGKASVNWEEIGYSPEEFMVFYRKALNEIIRMSIEGQDIREEHASILLKRMDGQFMNYMELRSPCGAGIGQIAYYPDGNVFTCDEGRMLYEMGEDTFKVGNVYENSYADMMSSGVCRTVCISGILEGIPTCCDCVYQPYCGTCPVVNYANANDVIEKNPRGYRCKIYSGMLDELFSRIQKRDTNLTNILKSWSE